LKKFIIAAISKNGIIGKEGKIPWHSKEEFKHFKNITMNYPIIMGRKTFESIGKPLPGRLNIVISRRKDLKYSFDNIKIFSGLSEAYNFCNSEKYEKIFIIGGGEIYKQAINEVDNMIITVMNLNVEGDTYFPEIDKKIWKIDSVEYFDEFEVHWYSRA
jgi:dihydrofolate reductase